MSQNTTYQGNRLGFTDITVDGVLQPLYGGLSFSFPKGVVQSLSWDAQQDAGIVQGNRVVIMGRTTGMATCTGSLELLAAECDDWFVNTLSQSNTYPVMAVYFNLTITYSVNGGADTRVDRLDGCRITKVGAANAKGNDATTKTLDLSIAVPWQNGVPLYGDLIPQREPYAAYARANRLCQVSIP